MNRVFEPFHRAEHSRSRADGDASFGLAVVLLAAIGLSTSGLSQSLSLPARPAVWAAMLSLLAEPALAAVALRRSAPFAVVVLLPSLRGWVVLATAMVAASAAPPALRAAASAPGRARLLGPHRRPGLATPPA